MSRTEKVCRLTGFIGIVGRSNAGNAGTRRRCFRIEDGCIIDSSIICYVNSIQYFVIFNSIPIAASVDH